MKRGTPDHPKTLALQQALGCSRIVAVGLLELLWHWTARYAPQGDIGRWPDEMIAKGVSWDGDPGALLRALVESGWLDPDRRCRFLVHDWADHADQAVKKSLMRQGLKIRTPSRRRPDKVRPVSGPPEPEPEPEPEPVQRSSVAVATASSSGASSWSRDACDDWIDRFGGTAPGGQIGKALKPLVKAHGWPKVRQAWRSYLEQTEAEYASPARFASTFGRWNGTALAPRARSPASRGSDIDAGVARMLAKAAEAAKEGR